MYVNPNLIEEDFANLTGWTDSDSNGAVSEIDPAGQLHLDCRDIPSGVGYGKRSKDIGTIGDGDYYAELKFEGDVWDAAGGTANGIRVSINAATNFLQATIRGDSSGNNGIYLYDGATEPKIYSHDWDNDWHTIVFYVHNSQTDVDIWIDKDPATEAADVTDADCSAGAWAADGFTDLYGYGSEAGNGEYHIDYIYVGDALGEDTANATFFGSNF